MNSADKLWKLKKLEYAKDKLVKWHARVSYQLTAERWNGHVQTEDDLSKLRKDRDDGQEAIDLIDAHITKLIEADL